MAIEVRGVCTLLLVFDMPTALRFYRDVLGFEIVDTSHPGAGDRVDWCYLRLDSAELMLNARVRRAGAAVGAGAVARRGPR